MTDEEVIEILTAYKQSVERSKDSDAFAIAIKAVEDIGELRLSTTRRNGKRIALLDAIRPKGRWTKISILGDEYANRIMCSNCGVYYLTDDSLELWQEVYKFCQECGAWMIL